MADDMALFQATGEIFDEVIVLQPKKSHLEALHAAVLCLVRGKIGI